MSNRLDYATNLPGASALSSLRRELGMFGALVLLCAGLYLSNSDFLSQANVLNTTKQIAMLGILATGVCFVIITGGIDLSIGSMVGLTGVLIAKVSSPAAGGMNYPIWVGILFAVSIALLVGLAQGLLITRLNLQPFIVTLGGMLLIRGVSQVIAAGGVISFGGSAFRQLAREGLIQTGQGPLLTWPVVIFLVVAACAAYLLHFTVFGRYVFAIGGNRDAAQYSGIPVKRVETLTYVISAGLAAVAGICYAAYIGQMSHQVGIAYELYAITAAVIGGVSLRGGEGTVLGVLVGSAIMRVIYNGINLFKFAWTDDSGARREYSLGTNWTDVVIGSVILIAVILDQLVHLLQQRRRTRAVAAAHAAAAEKRE